jgi:RES domain-containing protein
MTMLWRISEHADLNGIGGLYSAGRWNSRGRPIVYLAESPAAAMLERLVHLFDNEGGQLPLSYQLLQVSVPDRLTIQPLLEAQQEGWQERLRPTRFLGDEWLATAETPLARVPSAIAPHTWNYLLNPKHPGAAEITIVSQSRERFDNRLFQFGAREGK